MKERPILFSPLMVRAILAGTKTQTRRVLKLQPEAWLCEDGEMHFAGKMPDGRFHDVENDALGRFRATCPYGRPGDRLWVRETGWERPERTRKQMREGADTWPKFAYDADGWTEQDHADFKAWGFKRRPSIHMPHWASRILLEITAVRVERLQEISDADATAEGSPHSYHLTGGRSASENFEHLWWTINGDGSWESNPWVWVIEFKRVQS